MPRIARDWYLPRNESPTGSPRWAVAGGPTGTRGAAWTQHSSAPAGARATRTPGAARRAPSRPSWQMLGGGIAAGVLALAGIGWMVMSTLVAAPSGTTGDATGRPIVSAAVRPVDGADATAAVLRAIAEDPAYRDLGNLSADDVRRLSERTGLSPAQLTPILAQIMAAGQLASADEAVAGAQARRLAASATPTPMRELITRARYQTDARGRTIEILDQTEVVVSPDSRPGEVVLGAQARQAAPTATPRLDDSVLRRPVK